MLKITDYQKTTLEFTKDLNLMLSSKNISIEQFQNDFDSAKQQKQYDDFLNKYNQFFDGSIREYGKNIKNPTSEKKFKSFEGSYRRSVNPINFSQDKEIKYLQRKYRKVGIISARKINIGKPPTPTKELQQKLTIKNASQGSEHDLSGSLKSFVASLTQARYLNRLDPYKFTFQAVNLKINYDLVDSVGNTIVSNAWITKTIGISRSRTLLELYEADIDLMYDWIDEVSNYGSAIVEINYIDVEVFRIGEGR